MSASLQSRRDSGGDSGNEERSPQPVGHPPDGKRVAHATLQQRRAVTRAFLVVVHGERAASTTLETLTRRNDGAPYRPGIRLQREHERSQIFSSREQHL